VIPPTLWRTSQKFRRNSIDFLKEIFYPYLLWAQDPGFVKLYTGCYGFTNESKRTVLYLTPGPLDCRGTLYLINLK